MRKLSTIRVIGNLTPIEEADRIETAHIDGWTVVVGKGEFEIGQEVLFFEVDSMLPLDNPLFSFLEPRGVKLVDGVKYHRLKTAKLRGQISQGLIMSVPTELDTSDKERDFSEDLGVIKYEPALPINNTNLKHWPEWITHTDEERVQNLDKIAQEAIFTDRSSFIATEKIDGTSCTIWAKCSPNDKEISYGVCSRNYGLEEDPNDLYWKIATTKMLESNTKSPLQWLLNQVQAQVTKNSDVEHSVVLQGEIFGEKIQNNPLGTIGQHIRFFNLFIDGKYIPLSEIEVEYPELKAQWVPIHENVSLPSTIEEIISQPDGVMSLVPESQKNRQIEGFVWRHLQKEKLEGTKQIDLSKVPEDKRELVANSSKCQEVRASFKAISNKYLLKHDG